MNQCAATSFPGRPNSDLWAFAGSRQQGALAISRSRSGKDQGSQGNSQHTRDRSSQGASIGAVGKDVQWRRRRLIANMSLDEKLKRSYQGGGGGDGKSGGGSDGDDEDAICASKTGSP